MNISSSTFASHRYKRHRFPAEIIAHAVWLYFRVPLSLRHVEDLLSERGIDVSFQTLSESVAKFGSEFAALLRRRSKGGVADKWHLDEMLVTIKGRAPKTLPKTGGKVGLRSLILSRPMR